MEVRGNWALALFLSGYHGYERKLWTRVRHLKCNLIVIQEIMCSIPQVTTLFFLFFRASFWFCRASFLWRVVLYFYIRRPFRFGWDNNNIGRERAAKVT